ncbi:hypothetical protein [Solidesulfovibrio sp.]
MIKTAPEKSPIPPQNTGGSMAIAQEIMRGIQRVVDKFGSQNSMAAELGIKQLALNRFFRGSNTGYQDVCEWLDKLDARLLWPDQVPSNQRAVSFVSPEAPAEAKGCVSPDAYRAIPLVSLAAASIVGLIPDSKIDGWHLVSQNNPALMTRNNLVCCLVESGRQGMEPVATTGDVAVIDRDDIRVSNEKRGNIFLINDKYDGICLRRVRLEVRGRETLIIVYADNDSSPPYSVDASAGLDKEVPKVIIGRVVYLWSDLSKK